MEQIEDAPGDPGLYRPDGLFAALLATAVDGIIVADADGLIQIYNRACERLFGYAAAEAIGQNVKMLMPAPDHHQHDGYLFRSSVTDARRIIGTGREVVGQRKDGHTFSMYLSVGEGVLAGRQFFVGIIHDLTEMRQQAALREGADRLLAQIVQSSNDAIISNTLDSIITSWNASAERMYGYSAGEAIGQHISLVFPPGRGFEEDETLARLMLGGYIPEHETVRRHKDGRDVTVCVSVTPIHDGSGALIGASSTARDITEARAAEADMLALQNELAHVGRLNAMGQMSAAIAHELNQPLTAVANYVKAVQRLLEGDNPSPRQLQTARDAVEKAAGQTARAGTIMRQLRDFAEKRASEHSLQNANDVIREAMTLAMLGHRNVKLTLTLDPAVTPSAMDKVQIQQVLLNLARNAIEAMEGTRDPELTICSAADAAGVQITVRDNGPGFAPEIAGRLFQPFATTKENGMGIGLQICRSIVEAHAGTIEAVDANPGAVFVIRLPLCQQSL